MEAQGSNAHVVVEVNSSEPTPSITDTGSPIWQRARHWFAPAVHSMLQSYSGCSAGQLRFCGLLPHPALVHLGGCRSGGEHVLPIGAAAEVSAAHAA
jgi:hypothetical protein